MERESERQRVCITNNLLIGAKKAKIRGSDKGPRSVDATRPKHKRGGECSKATDCHWTVPGNPVRIRHHLS